MQATYPKKLPITHWDNLNLKFPVTNYPQFEISSENIARRWQVQPEVLREPKEPCENLKEFNRDYNTTKNLTQSQTNVDFGYKAPERSRFNKHNALVKNEYVYPPNKKFAVPPSRCSSHGTTEMKSSYAPSNVASRLCTGKDQHIVNLEPYVEPTFKDELEPIDTTCEGFEKYLDPYLTTSRLHHRPYTANELKRTSASKDIVTYHTLSKDPWVRTPKPIIEDWRLPMKRPHTTYDRKKFKDDFREIIIHNKPNWVPGSFVTETRNKYAKSVSLLHSQIHSCEEDIRALYFKSLARLPTNVCQEDLSLQGHYTTEYSHSHR